MLDVGVNGGEGGEVGGCWMDVGWMLGKCWRELVDVCFFSQPVLEWAESGQLGNS